MAEPKPIASLTSGLLARKGAAQPAMRRPSLGGWGNSAPAPIHDDLGWNDMGHTPEPAPVAPAPVRPVSSLAGVGPTATAPQPVPQVLVDQAVLADRVRETITEPAVAAAGRKAAFTLRLDSERHLRLRLACAMQNRSAQQIVTQALDKFLDDQPEIDRMAGMLPRASGDN